MVIFYWLVTAVLLGLLRVTFEDLGWIYFANNWVYITFVVIVMAFGHMCVLALRRSVLLLNKFKKLDNC